jgi:hypothetical protein
MSDWRVATEQPKFEDASKASNWKVAPYQDDQEGFFSKLPRNIVAGLAQGGHELLNSPYDLGKFIEQQGKQFGESVNKAFPLEKYGIKQPQFDFSAADYIPHQQDYDFAQMLGQKGPPTFGDKAVQGITHYAPELLMGINALKNVVPPLTKRGATKKLNLARQTFKDWAENQPSNLNNKLNVDPQLIEDARQYLPNNLAERHLLDTASNDYDKLFNLQSQVGKVSAKRMGKLTSIFAPESRLKGEAGLRSRKELIKAIHENLQSEGLLDTSNLLREGQNDFRRYIKFRPYRNAIALAGLGAIGNEVAPKNPLTDLMKKLMLHAAKN